MRDQHVSRIMSGSGLAAEIVQQSLSRAAALRSATGVRPLLAAVIVGDEPSSHTYVRMKQRACERAGIGSRILALPETTTTTELVAALRHLSLDPSVHGILLQHPVPTHIDERAAFDAITPTKDVDGVSSESFAAMAWGRPGFLSCTPSAILRLLDAHAVPLQGAHAVVIGQGPILGKPLGMLLLSRRATVTLCHEHTADLSAHVRGADVVIAATGVPGLVRGDWLRQDAVVIDAGYRNRQGDVVFEEAVTRARLITPVPGGVGPVTVAVLLEQTVDAAATAVGQAESVAS